GAVEPQSEAEASSKSLWMKGSGGAPSEISAWGVSVKLWIDSMQWMNGKRKLSSFAILLALPSRSLPRRWDSRRRAGKQSGRWPGHGCSERWPRQCPQASKPIGGILPAAICRKTSESDGELSGTPGIGAHTNYCRQTIDAKAGCPFPSRIRRWYPTAVQRR